VQVAEWAIAAQGAFDWQILWGKRTEASFATHPRELFEKVHGRPAKKDWDSLVLVER
jgi:hypothetical protein